MLTLSRKNQDWLPTVLFNNFFDNDFMGHMNVATTKPAVNVIETANDYNAMIKHCYFGFFCETTDIWLQVIIPKNDIM